MAADLDRIIRFYSEAFDASVVHEIPSSHAESSVT